MRAREEAETQKVQAEERLKADTARIRTDEQLGIQTENQAREIAVAEKNRERVIADRDRAHREGPHARGHRPRAGDRAARRSSKDKELEDEKRAIAEVIRERIAVEKTVAEQEENIKRLRVVEEAERTRQAIDHHAPRPRRRSAWSRTSRPPRPPSRPRKHKAREELVLAEARQQAAELDTRAKIRLAEGTQAAGRRRRACGASAPRSSGSATPRPRSREGRPRRGRWSTGRRRSPTPTACARS